MQIVTRFACLLRVAGVFHFFDRGVHLYCEGNVGNDGVFTRSSVSLISVFVYRELGSLLSQDKL